MLMHYLCCIVDHVHYTPFAHLCNSNKWNHLNKKEGWCTCAHHPLFPVPVYSGFRLAATLMSRLVRGLSKMNPPYVLPYFPNGVHRMEVANTYSLHLRFASMMLTRCPLTYFLLLATRAFLPARNALILALVMYLFMAALCNDFIHCATAFCAFVCESIH